MRKKGTKPNPKNKQTQRDGKGITGGRTKGEKRGGALVKGREGKKKGLAANEYKGGGPSG